MRSWNANINEHMDSCSSRKRCSPSCPIFSACLPEAFRFNGSPAFVRKASFTDVTLLGFFLVTKAILLGMMRRKSGRIINIVSTAGESGLPGQTNYSAAKAGLIGATKSLAKEVIRKGVSRYIGVAGGIYGNTGTGVTTVRSTKIRGIYE